MNLDVLPNYLIDHVWNEVFLHHRVNIIPEVISKRAVAALWTDDISLQMPEDELFYVFAFQSNLTTSLNIEFDTWVRTDVLCNDHDTLLHTFTRKGLMMHKGEVYILRSSEHSVYFVAVKKHVMNMALSAADLDKVYFTIYEDSDILGQMTTKTYHIPDNDVSSLVRNEIRSQLGKNCHYMIVDGTFRDPATVKLQEGTTVDIMIDEDAVIVFDVDLTLDKNNRKYRSERMNMYMQIIHIPKALNPKNGVITHDTVDFAIFGKDSEGNLVEGRYLHRVQDEDKTVLNITHNDFGIPVYLIDAYRDYLGVDEIVIRVMCKTHGNDNELVRDANFIDELYRWHNDDDIVDILAGRNDLAPAYWRAENLDKSKYIEMFFDTPNGSVVDSLGDYIAALGYYHVLALICTRVHTFTVTNIFRGIASIQKSAAYENLPVYPVVYLNDKKILHEDITYIDDDNQITIRLSDKVVRKPGDRITVELFIDEDNRRDYFANIYRITPSVESAYVEIPYGEFEIYEKVSIDPAEAAGVDVTVDYTYRKMEDLTGLVVVTTAENGNKILQFARATHGREYVIQSTTSVFYMYKNIDVDVHKGNPLAYVLKQYDSEGKEEVEVLTMRNPIVFLNGKHLVKSVDYDLYDVEYTGVSMQQIVISCAEYLKENGNFIEVIGVHADNEDFHYGFVRDDTVMSDHPTAVYFKQISTLHVDGVIDIDATIYPDRLELVPGRHRNGALYSMRTTVPHTVKEFMDQYHKNEDIEKLKILNVYLNGVREPFSGVQMIHHSHRLYSVHYAALIRDVCTGQRPGLGIDPDVDRMFDQIKEYDFLKAYDVVHAAPERLDLNYIDILPTYFQFSAPYDQTKALRRFAEILLPEDEVKFSQARIHV